MGQAIVLGNKVRDKVTGFEGVAVERCSYLDGTSSVKVESQTLSKEEGVPVVAWFWEVRLTFVELSGLERA